MNPAANSPDLVEPEVLLIRRYPSSLCVRRGEISFPSSLLIRFTMWVMLVPGHISADYFGIYCERLKQHLSAGNTDPPFVAMMANGTSGDINNIPFVSRERPVRLRPNDLLWQKILRIKSEMLSPP